MENNEKLRPSYEQFEEAMKPKHNIGLLPVYLVEFGDHNGESIVTRLTKVDPYMKLADGGMTSLFTWGEPDDEGCRESDFCVYAVGCLIEPGWKKCYLSFNEPLPDVVNQYVADRKLLIGFL